MPARPSATTLTDQLDRALTTGRVPGSFADPADERERLLCLLTLGDARYGALRSAADLQAAEVAEHPTVGALRWRLEQAWIDELTNNPAAPAGITAGRDGAGPATGDPEEVCAQLRRLAARDRLPAVYRWLRSTASREDLVDFLAVEGGPDADFDDLVSLCQVGLSGSAKLELGQNYWDEMGNGVAADVHTQLHHDMARALGMPRIPRRDLPVPALARSALGTLLAGRHHLQPEMVGALGLIELQAGPRCRLVLAALDRVGAPAQARPFYEVHADVDPRHGKDWLDKAVVPLVSDQPAWGPRIVRGAQWRSAVNARFFRWAEQAYARPAAQVAAA